MLITMEVVFAGLQAYVCPSFFSIREIPQKVMNRFYDVFSEGWSGHNEEVVLFGGNLNPEADPGYFK